MKKSILTAICILAGINMASAQTTLTEKKTDSVARLAIKYMNDGKPDSVYAMTDDRFRTQITASTWSTLYTTQMSQLLPFTKVEFVKSTDGVNVYKLTGKMILTYNVSIDPKNKIHDFSFVPYQQ